MESLQTLKHRVASMSDLMDIIGALRALAGIRVQEAQATLQGIRLYSNSIANALGQAANLLDSDETKSLVGLKGQAYAHDKLLIVFMSEHGFVGNYNQILIKRTEQETHKTGEKIFILGSRGIATATEHGLIMDGGTPMITHQASVLKLARTLSHEVYRRIAIDNIHRVSLVFARSESMIASDITVRTLLPLDLRHFESGLSKVAPLHTLPSHDLVERLAEEYVVAELAHVITEALASENGARLKTMDKAHINISDKLDDLKHLEHQIRQDQITIELLEIIAGAEAIMEADPITK